MPYPESIKNAPELCMGLQLFMQAFIDLDSSRQIGMETGRIGWLTIFDYCDRLGIVGDQRDDVIYHVEQLDTFYLSWLKEKDK